MAENSIHVRKRGFHLGIRKKIMIPVILTNIFIGVVNSIEDIVDSVGVERIYTVGYDPSGNLCHLVDIRKDESEGIEIYSRGKRKTSYHCNSTDKNKVRRSNRCGIYRI